MIADPKQEIRYLCVDLALRLPNSDATKLVEYAEIIHDFVTDNPKLYSLRPHTAS